MYRLIDMAGGNGKRAPARGGEVVVVTGASAGVDRAVVRELAGRGARIGWVDRREILVGFETVRSCWRSPQTWVNTHRALAIAGLLAGGASWLTPRSGG